MSGDEREIFSSSLKKEGEDSLKEKKTS